MFAALSLSDLLAIGFWLAIAPLTGLWLCGFLLRMYLRKRKVIQ